MLIEIGESRSDNAIFKNGNWYKGRILKNSIIYLFLLLIFIRLISESDFRKYKLRNSSTNSEVILHLKKAENAFQLMRGLMFVDRLPQGYGMLFIMDKEGRKSFWMKNTYIPLDLIFIDDTMQVKDLVRSAVPGNETPIIPGSSYRYVIELISGSIDRYDIGIGDYLSKEIDNSKLE